MPVNINGVPVDKKPMQPAPSANSQAAIARLKDMEFQRTQATENRQRGARQA